jgi:hypothetical protein
VQWEGERMRKQVLAMHCLKPASACSRRDRMLKLDFASRVVFKSAAAVGEVGVFNVKSDGEMNTGTLLFRRRLSG